MSPSEARGSRPRAVDLDGLAGVLATLSPLVQNYRLRDTSGGLPLTSGSPALIQTCTEFRCSPYSLATSSTVYWRCSVACRGLRRRRVIEPHLVDPAPGGTDRAIRASPQVQPLLHHPHRADLRAASSRSTSNLISSSVMPAMRAALRA